MDISVPCFWCDNLTYANDGAWSEKTLVSGHISFNLDLIGAAARSEARL